MKTNAPGTQYHPVVMLWPNNNESPTCAEVDYAVGSSAEAAPGSSLRGAADIPGGPARCLQCGEVFRQRQFRVSGVRGDPPAQHLPGAVVFRRRIGENGFDDYGGLMSDSSGIGGMLRAGYQVIWILFFWVSWCGRRLHRHGLFLWSCSG
jgi:hypothetical protein